MSMYLRTSRGFTLIELMVVVAIVAFLAAVAVPSYLKFHSKAKTAEASNNLAVIRAGQELYRAEYDAYLTCSATPAVVPSGITATWSAGGAAEFARIGLVLDGGVHYQYAVTVTGLTYTATATGDVDGDSSNAVYQLTSANPKPVLTTPGEL